MTDFQRELLEFRARNNLRQSDLCKILGIGKNGVYRYENGLSIPYAVNLVKYRRTMKEWEESKNAER